MIATLGRRPAFRSGVELLEFLADFLRPPVPQHLAANHSAVHGEVIARRSPLGVLDEIEGVVIQIELAGSRSRHWANDRSIAAARHGVPIRHGFPRPIDRRFGRDAKR